VKQKVMGLIKMQIQKKQKNPVFLSLKFCIRVARFSEGEANGRGNKHIELNFVNNSLVCNHVIL
jgi:hypothetical protein